MLKPNAVKLTLPKIMLPNADHEYVQPKKAVHNESMMKEWENSEAYNEYFGFIKAMNIAVRGKPLSYECHTSEITLGIISLLKSLDQMVTETPPIDQPQRFGNKAFKIWYEKLQKEAGTLLKENLPEEFHKSLPEIADYLTESFGNSTRIDYGTGHEMSFCMFLCCLFKIGAFKEEDCVAVVNKVFNRYMELVRRLQTTYRMEPAGSHGVWSLDDYQFVPFIWGSSQFVGRPIIEPNMFVQESVIKKYASEYMFIGCINYITTVKSGHFSEHSNQLWNISGIATWSKVNEGLIKMYQGEVLNKFPVVQHVLFGSLIRFVPFDKNVQSSSQSSSDAFKKPVAGDG
ncbi:serine/threonine-protein phosphatase 2A activator-like [Planococcus citri]|uniref:serine/threonine-protein phosphatase 2A activator-like n=1 Tax=Planococcus citri TaxID=170843 RepID=UPI0031F74E54